MVCGCVVTLHTSLLMWRKFPETGGATCTDETFTFMYKVIHMDQAPD
jgi:hypothetical protein